jgi:hypothetical protein
MADKATLLQQQWVDCAGTMLISFITYYHPTCSELLELHLKLLGDSVDHWVITESNFTHAGNPAAQGLRQRLWQLGWPRDRVTVVDLVIPSTDCLDVQDIDHHNTHENFTQRKLGGGDMANVQARARERLQKDSLLQVLDRFPDDSVFLHSDCDEIIDPRHLPYLTQMCRQNPGVIIKVPLVYLQGRADLRTHVRATGEPVPWDGGMFLATKNHFRHATPTQIRGTNFNPWPIRYITQDGTRCEDLGWHFSWMGTDQQRRDKSQNFTHYHDDLSWLATQSYDSAGHQHWMSSQRLVSGETPPSGDTRHQLQSYPLDLLPQQIMHSDTLRAYLLPEPVDTVTA